VLGQRPDGHSGVGNDDIRNAGTGDEVLAGGTHGRRVGHVERVGVHLARPACTQLLQGLAPTRANAEHGPSRRVVFSECPADAR
jgi:hypothetical protein